MSMSVSYLSFPLDACDVEEQSHQFPGVMTNSSGLEIGGSCSGAGVILCILLYFLYWLLTHDRKDKRKRVNVMIIQESQAPGQARTAWV